MTHKPKTKPQLPGPRSNALLTKPLLFPVIPNSMTCLIPVDGQWTDWVMWSVCTATCGGGQRTRQRSCQNPPPIFGGADCVGEATQAEDCNVDPCAGGYMSSNQTGYDFFIFIMKATWLDTCFSTVAN